MVDCRTSATPPQCTDTVKCNLVALDVTMNRKAEALTVAQQLEEKIAQLALNGGTRPSKDGFLFRRLWAEIDRVDNPVISSNLKSKLLAIAGDLDQAMYWNANAVRNGGQYLETEKFLAFLINGRTHEASEFFDEAVAKRGETPLHRFMQYAATAGWFDRVQALVATAQAQKLVFKPTVWIQIAPAAARILEQQGFTRDMMNDTMAEMQRLLSEAKTHWCGSMPMISLEGEGTAYSFVRMQFPVAFDANQAAEMSWRLTERLVAKDLDRPGLIVNFVAADSHNTDTKEAVSVA